MSKLKYEQVKEEVEGFGLHLISEKYVNLKTELILQCSLQHEFQKTLTSLRKDAICPVCKSNELYKTNIKLNAAGTITKKKDIIRVLALDNSTQTTGYAIFDNNELMYYSAIIMDDRNSTKRIAKMRQWMVNMIEQWKPDVVVLENVQLQQNPQVFKLLAQLLGVLENSLFEMSMKYYIVDSSIWKSYNKVKGRNRAEQKKNAQNMIVEKYGIQCTEDESDAILLGKYVCEEHIKQNTFISWK